MGLNIKLIQYLQKLKSVSKRNKSTILILPVNICSCYTLFGFNCIYLHYIDRVRIKSPGKGFTDPADL